MNDGLTIKRGGSWRAAIASRQLPVFVVLAFAFSWYPWIIALAQGRTSGPNPLGPFIAALVVTGIAKGWPGTRELLGRIVRVRFGLRWYAVIFALPLLFCGTAIAIMALFGASIARPETAALRELPDRFLFIFLFIGLGEEPGWRGFALPRLQKEHTPLRASLILAPIWALWHLPLMGHEFPLAVIPAFLLSLLGGTLIQTWLFNRTRGSVFAQMLFHATVNTVGAGLVFPLMKGSAFIVFWYVYAALWCALGVLVILWRGAEAKPAWPRSADPGGLGPRPDRI